MNTTADFKRGDRVVYRLAQEPEEGVVTSADGNHVWVCYGWSATSQPHDPLSLEHVRPPGPGPEYDHEDCLVVEDDDGGRNFWNEDDGNYSGGPGDY